jgi:hypothetical protein
VRSPQDKNSNISILFKGGKILLVASKCLFDLECSAIPQLEPYDLRGKAMENLDFGKIGVLGDYYESALLGIFPNGHV